MRSACSIEYAWKIITPQYYISEGFRRKIVPLRVSRVSDKPIDFVKPNMDKLSCERASNIQEKTKPKLLSCCACDFVTYDKPDLDEHLLDHYSPMKFKCEQCRFSCRTLDVLDKHVRLLHSDFRKFRCTDCAYTANTYDRLQAHVKRSCRGNQDQNTDDGHAEGRSTGRKEKKHRRRSKVREFGSYKRHPMPHLNVASYPTATESSSNVRVDNMKTLVCPECGYPAGSEERLESHRRVHDSFKPYECEKCSYVGFDKAEFNYHAKSHSDECKFRCGDCNYATNHHHALKLHLRRNKHFSEMLQISDDSHVLKENVHQPSEDNEVEIIEI